MAVSTSRVDRPGERGANVVELPLQAAFPIDALGSHHVGDRLLAKPDEVGGMRGTERLRLPELSETLLGVLADGLE